MPLSGHGSRAAPEGSAWVSASQSSKRGVIVILVVATGVLVVATGSVGVLVAVAGPGGGDGGGDGRTAPASMCSADLHSHPVL